MSSATRQASKAIAPSPAPRREGGGSPSRASGNAQVPARERREGPRRKPMIDRAAKAPMPAMKSTDWLPKRWTYVTLAMGMSIILSALYSGDFATPLTMSALVLSVLLTMLVPALHRYAQSPSLAKRLACLAVGLAIPFLLFGFGMSHWAEIGGISWDIALACMLCVTGVAPAYLRGRPPLVFLTKFAIWLPVSLVYSSAAAYTVMAIGVLVSIVVTREQQALIASERERMDAQERVQTRARDILADYEETGQGWFWETDRRSLLTYVSPPVAKALRRNPDRLIGQPLTRLFDLEDTGGEGERTLMFHLSARSAFSELPVRAAIDTEERWWSVSGRPIYDQFDNFVGFRGSGTDLTERKRSQEQATRLARYDALTGLANRLQMSQALEKILSAQAEANRHCAILLLDLDRFKQVNDTMGHPAGDALLKQVAQRLERSVGQMGQVGRLGGDEFKVIVPTQVEYEILAGLARDIIHSLSQPYSIDGQRVVIGASVGVAIAPENGNNSEELIRNADLALYAAKDGGRGRYHFYSEDLHAAAEARAQLEEDLRDAVTNGDLELHYQPVVSMQTDKICGFEALLRWQHPVKGWISPERFIGIAEDSGLIQQIGEWALRKACDDLSHWPEEVRVAVNVSPVQFSNSQLPTIVANAISQAGIRASRLELEITESVFLGDDEGTEAMFASLKRVGVRLALDDFGTGFSSLGYLKKAPFDKIKIDQSFVRGVTEKGSRNGAIIESITGLAKSLGMDTTAEGIETQDELDLIRGLGCSHVQGYVYDRPLTFDVATSRLAGDLSASLKGPKTQRAPRQTMLRKVILDHHGHCYNGTIRNLSVTGAMIEGLWNVPVGTEFRLQVSTNFSVTCTTRWALNDRMGVEFAEPLEKDSAGQIIALHGPAPRHLSAEELKKAS